MRDSYGRFIRTAQVCMPVRKAGGYKKWVEAEVEARWMCGVNWETRGSVLAEVANAVWRVDCPFCSGAQVIEPFQPFFCVDCLMAGNDGYAMTISWPSPEERRAAEVLLLARPAPVNMNWLRSKGETVQTLVLENIAHEVAYQFEEVRQWLGQRRVPAQPET